MSVHRREWRGCYDPSIYLRKEVGNKTLLTIDNVNVVILTSKVALFQI